MKWNIHNLKQNLPFSEMEYASFETELTFFWNGIEMEFAFFETENLCP